MTIVARDRSLSPARARGDSMTAVSPEGADSAPLLVGVCLVLSAGGPDDHPWCALRLARREGGGPGARVSVSPSTRRCWHACS